MFLTKIQLKPHLKKVQMLTIYQLGELSHIDAKYQRLFQQQIRSLYPNKKDELVEYIVIREDLDVLIDLYQRKIDESFIQKLCMSIYMRRAQALLDKIRTLDVIPLSIEQRNNFEKTKIYLSLLHSKL